MKRLFENENGYTLVETLIALAILIAVLIPLGQFVARVMYNDLSRDLIIAQQLAVMEMEKAIALNDFEKDEIVINLNQKKWRIVKSVIKMDRLVELNIAVFKSNRNKSLIQLKTLRFVDAEQ